MIGELIAGGVGLLFGVLIGVYLGLKLADRLVMSAFARRW